MILYFDTSALVKLFFDEAGSDVVRESVAASAGVTTHLIAYAEACSVFTRVADRKADKRLYSRLRNALDDYWRDWQIITVDEQLVRRAADLSSAHSLRGYDSVHLAAAEAVFHATRGIEFRFAVFDTYLGRAAQAIGMGLLEP